MDVVGFYSLRRLLNSVMSPIEPSNSQEHSQVFC